jgi:hypothetical protein
VSFDLGGAPPILSDNALQIVVANFDNGYAILPNVRCLQIDNKEGPEPPVARFQYILDDSLAANNGWPSQTEQIFPIDAQGDYVVNVDDRLVVMAILPDGTPWILFDGFAQIPQCDITSSSQSVTFAATGVAIRTFDRPISGRTQRNADKETTTDGTEDVQMDLPCRFNPANNTVGSEGGYIGNCVATADYTTAGKLGSYPVFIEELLAETDALNVTYWWISDAIKYLLATETKGYGQYVTWPTFDSIEALLSAQVPDDTGTSAGASADITIRDYDAANKALADVIAELLSYGGFLTCWETTTDGNGNPKTYLRIYRRDGAATRTPKLLYLAPTGGAIDPSTSNAIELHLARDSNKIVNAWEIETAQRQVEITVILAPAFVPEVGDELTPTRDEFKTSNLTNASAADKRRYRWYTADEIGDGHWNTIDAMSSHQPFDFSDVFPPDSDGTPSYVRRYRPGSRALITKDDLGKPRHATLEIAYGFSGSEPFLNDGAVTTWQTVGHGWQLLPDRLGIEVSIEDPEEWDSGNPKVGEIRGITAQANPAAPADNFVLRLTTVIEDDLGLGIIANKRVSSPTRFPRYRSADGKDHFQHCSVSVNSLYYKDGGGDGTNPLVVRDDTKDAKTHAKQLRSAHEFPTLAGSATLPFVTGYYRLGDLVKGVYGRNISFATNAGASQGEKPTYAWIVGVSWTFEGGRQQTVLQFSDERAEPQKYRG